MTQTIREERREYKIYLSDDRDRPNSLSEIVDTPLPDGDEAIATITCDGTFVEESNSTESKSNSEKKKEYLLWFS